ncbi:unnamed protein product, partial [Mesorhabditis spiculigera]
MMNDGVPDDDDDLNLRREERVKTGFWQQCLMAVKGCGLFCYLACPPIPEHVARKFAFHPPPRGEEYILRRSDKPTEWTTDARQVHGKPFYIELTAAGGRKSESQRDSPENVNLRSRCKFFTVETRRKNTIVAVHAKPRMLRDEHQVVIFAQPNSTDLGWWTAPVSSNVMHMADRFACDVVAFDYSGFGCSSGYPSEGNIYSDITAVYAHVRQTRPHAEIILMGYSIGTTCAVDLASTRPAGLTGVILVAPFASGMRLFLAPETVESGGSFCLQLDRFKNVDKVAQIDVPTLICHGNDDVTTPVSHGKHPVPMLIMHGADHSSILNERTSETMARINRFLRHETSGSRPKPPEYISNMILNPEPIVVVADDDCKSGGQGTSVVSMTEIDLRTEPKASDDRIPIKVGEKAPLSHCLGRLVCQRIRAAVCALPTILTHRRATDFGEMEAVTRNADWGFLQRKPYGTLMALQTVLAFALLVLTVVAPYKYDGAYWASGISGTIFLSSLLYNLLHVFRLQNKLLNIGTATVYCPATLIIFVMSVIFGLCMCFPLLTYLIDSIDSLRYQFRHILFTFIGLLLVAGQVLVNLYLAILLFRAAPNSQALKLSTLYIEGSKIEPLMPGPTYSSPTAAHPPPHPQFTL